MQRWMFKVAAQFMLAHVPGGERINYRLQLLSGRHSPAAVAKGVTNYAQRLRVIDQHKPLESATVVEIGTGWEPHSALLLHLLGARVVHTYDHVRHLRFPLLRLVVASMIDQADEVADLLGRPRAVVRQRLAALDAQKTLDDLLTVAQISYHAPGDAAASGLSDHSVDLVYSYAVLEHVPWNTVVNLTREARRVLRRDGIAYHGIGIADHYSGRGVSKVNFLRYPEWAWRLLVQNKISYHNRMRERQFLDIFRAHGARLERVWSETEETDLSALRGMRIDPRFAAFTPEELAVTHTEVIMTFGEGTGAEPAHLIGRPSPGTTDAHAPTSRVIRHRRDLSA